MPGRVSYGLRVLHVEVRLGGGVARVVLAAVDPLDGVGRVYRVRATFSHELPQICWARVVVQVAHNREHIPVRCDRHIGGRVVQPAQVPRRDFVKATRQRPHELSRRNIRSRSGGAPPRCLPQSARRGEVRCRHDGLHVCVQHSGECIADRTENNGVIRPCAPVVLVRRAEQFIGLGHGHAGQHQPAAAMCH